MASDRRHLEVLPVGEIRCPKKGTIALARCEELQIDSGAEGDTCTCSVYLAHPASRLLPNGRPKPGRNLGHSKNGSNCGNCKNPSPKGTRISGGLCKPCRDAGTLAAAPVPVLQVKAVAAAPATISAAPRPTPPVAPRTVNPAQLVSTALTEGDLRNLHKDLLARDKTIERMRWAVRSYLEGYLKRSDLGRHFGLEGEHVPTSK